MAGAVTVTAALMLAVYAIVNGNQQGWLSAQTLGLLAVSVGPARPLPLHRVARLRAARCRFACSGSRNVSTANIVAMLWAAAMFAWFFLSALYLQLVLGYTPLQVGLSFLPGNVVMGILSVSVSARLVMRYGIKRAARRSASSRPRSGCCWLRSRAGRRHLRHRRAARA